MAMVKVADATGKALDWMVARAEGFKPHMHRGCLYPHYVDDRDACAEWSPSNDPGQGSLIIERAGISTRHWGDDWDNKWSAFRETGHHSDEGQDDRCGFGSTMLIAAMRCFVVSKLGVEVEVPDTLL